MLSYCGDMSYTQTLFPNIAGHRTREEAEGGAEYLLLSVVEALLGGKCNPEIRMLGCSVLAPRCEKDAALRPCRSACEAVRARCARAFEAIEMNWPYFLDCDRFFAGEHEGCHDPLEGLHGETARALPWRRPPGGAEVAARLRFRGESPFRPRPDPRASCLFSLHGEPQKGFLRAP